MTAGLKISSSFCFNSENHLSILDVFKSFESYNLNQDKAKVLDYDVPIFLDTNVLADYYRLSFSERQQLKEILEKYKSRIHITKQVEKEFLSNRIGIIKNFNKRLKDELLSKFGSIKDEIEALQAGKVRGFNEFLVDKRLNDYPELREDLKILKTKIENKSKEVYKSTDFGQQIKEQGEQIRLQIDKTLERSSNIEKKDEILAVFAQFIVTPELSNEETEFLKKHYNQLLGQYDKYKGDQNISWKYTFPGCGESKEKDEPLGDFIIYHEMLKFMKTEGTDVIFLTNDVTKKDWVSDNKAENYNHYIEQTFLNTGKIMYIYHAKNVLNISYENIYSEPSKPASEYLIKENNGLPIVKNSDIILNDIEFDIVKRILAAQMGSDDFVSVYSIQNDLRRLYPDYSISVATKALEAKKFIQFSEIGDINGNTYKVCGLTKFAEGYIYENQDKFLDRYDRNGNIAEDLDDLPF